MVNIKSAAICLLSVIANIGLVLIVAAVSFFVVALLTGCDHDLDAASDIVVQVHSWSDDDLPGDVQSGVVIGNNGFVLCSAHGISNDNDEVYPYIDVLPDGLTRYQAVLVAVDHDADIALLRVIGKGFDIVSPLKICGNPKPLQHAEAWALRPIGYRAEDDVVDEAGHEVRDGYLGPRLSATRRVFRGWTSPGFSGGPVITTRDECIVGIDSMGNDLLLPRSVIATPLGSSTIHRALESNVPEVLP